VAAEQVKDKTVVRTILGILAGILIGAAITSWTMSVRHGANDEEARTEEKEASRVVHEHGRTLVKLDGEEQRRAGLQTAALEAAVLNREVKGYGRVLDPAPLSAQVVEIATARAALEASTKEFNRLRVLHAPDQGVSTRALEEAQAVMTRDQIAFDAAQLRLVVAWGKPIVSQPDLPGFVHALASLDIALVRVDVPLGTALEHAPTGARIAALTAPERPVDAQLLGPAVTADPQMQAQGFLFLVKNSSLPPGAAVVAWLSLPGEQEKGVIIPRSAIVRHEGRAFIYMQSGDELFERHTVELNHPTEAGWFVDDGAGAGQNAVVVGAQELLSEELRGTGEAED
jgi:hypothetical protein